VFCLNTGINLFSGSVIHLKGNVHGELCCVGPVEGTDSLLPSSQMNNKIRVQVTIEADKKFITGTDVGSFATSQLNIFKILSRKWKYQKWP
jgi:hypothetical protein